MPNNFPEVEKRKLGIQALHFCERLFDEFQAYYEVATGETLNEEMFNELLSNIEDHEEIKK